MQIIWKSGVASSQLEDRITKGAELLELHLEKKDLDNMSELINRLKPFNNIIEIVHTPIQEEYTIEGLHSREHSRTITKTFELAQEISNSKRIIDVVVHQTMSLERLKKWGMYDTIMARLYFLLNKFPNIRINLENLTVIGNNNTEKTPEGMKKVMRDSYFKESYNLCHELRKDLKTDRVGLVWDVCHGVSSYRLLEHLIKVGYVEEITKEKYISTYIPYLNVVHLANTRGYGYEKGHGAPFDRGGEEIELKEIIDLLKKYEYNKKVTLEVWEENYRDVKNCVYMDKQVKELLLL